MFESNYSIPEDIVSRSNQDGTVILMKMDEGSTFFKINGAAAEIWKEMVAKKDLNQIAEEMFSTYNAPKEQIQSDIKNFVETLVSKNLLVKA
ncbi:PqqD family protein [Bacteriovorax stolpii]|uniref:Uncharacterized protein n=1 Tax=Bacteriovorax stolpii TaxID=960 RepID=A0A2K9NZ26_BACTC|nr:PqqD family protein [Bacteriovorax stolpii]AUN99944.1 hypothetical protein C0V70_17895 [Bacteriovorax stolpii]QDK40063.1 PqqD family protein [Bacteriovorax stolpii]TDP54162.1 coenzyme PQQ synthesis protein D (PqqD) [Bacteriovorax stolpii]